MAPGFRDEGAALRSLREAVNNGARVPLWGTIPFLLFAVLVSQTADRGEIKIMSFNIRYGTANDGENSWSFRKNPLLDVLRSEAPHVLGIQEGLRFQLDEIRAAFPRYAEAGRGRDDGRTDGEYAAILFDTNCFSLERQETFWFSDTPSIPGSTNWGNTIPRICTWARLRERGMNSIIDIYNVHLDHESQRSRERSAAALIDTIRSKSTTNPVFLLGDFNAGERNAAIRSIRGAGFLDTYRIIHSQDSLAGTFHAFNGSRSGEKIDYIFTDSTVSVIGADILHDQFKGRFPSDHFPVTARVRINNPR